jgi:hypothetical protein
MLRASFAFALLVGFVASAAAADAAPPTKPSPDPKSLVVTPEELSKAKELVQKLGNEAFVERESAERDLASMGRLARAALLEGVNLDPDPEIRARCRTLLPKATAEEMKARLDSFLADTEGKYEHDLPGWHQLRATVRGEWKMFGWTYTVRPNADKAARELFIEFMKAPGGRQVLAAVSGTPEDLGAVVATRKTEIYQAMYPRIAGVTPRVPTPYEVGVVVFAESQVHSRYVPRAIALSTSITRSNLQSMVNGTDGKAVAMRAVMNAWFDSRTDAAELYAAYTLANNMQNHDASGRLAGRIMSTPGVQGFYKGQVLTTMVRQKATDQLPNIEKAFTDTTVLTTTIKVVNGMQVRQTIEVRDAALAAALVMTGQEPGDYGFESFPKNTGVNFSYAWARIPEDKRKEAFEKWKTWREKNP